MGDPHLEATLELMLALSRGGADAIELIFPFGDPMFHGKVVRRATHRAMFEEVGWEELVDLMRDFRAEDDETLVYATIYSSVLYRRGFEASADHLRSAEIDAISIPDMPWDEAGEATIAIRGEGLEVISMIASTTSETRCAAIAADAQAFILWSGHAGGDFTDTAERLRESMEHVRTQAKVPVLAAMQISTPEEAAEASGHADGVIVGSSLVWQIEGRGADIEERIESYVRDIRRALDA